MISKHVQYLNRTSNLLYPLLQSKLLFVLIIMVITGVLVCSRMLLSNNELTDLWNSFAKSSYMLEFKVKSFIYRILIPFTLKICIVDKKNKSNRSFMAKNIMHSNLTKKSWYFSTNDFVRDNSLNSESRQKCPNHFNP